MDSKNLFNDHSPCKILDRKYKFKIFNLLCEKDKYSPKRSWPDFATKADFKEIMDKLKYLASIMDEGFKKREKMWNDFYANQSNQPR